MQLYSCGPALQPQGGLGRLGHASIVITLDTYSHVLPDMQNDAVDGCKPC